MHACADREGWAPVVACRSNTPVQKKNLITAHPGGPSRGTESNNERSRHVPGSIPRATRKNQLLMDVLLKF